MVRTIRGTSKGWFNLKIKKAPVPRKVLKCYQKRNNCLLILGYEAYQDYLKSDVWKKIRARKLSKHKYCLLCDNLATQVHHLDYNQDTLLGRKDFRLVQLCRNHHEEIEFEGTRKLSVREATGKLFRLAEQCERGKSWIKYMECEEDKYKKRKRRENRQKAKRGKSK